MFTGRKYGDNSTLSTTPYLPYYYLISLSTRLVSDISSLVRKKEGRKEKKEKVYKQAKKRAKLVEIAARSACLS